MNGENLIRIIIVDDHAIIRRPMREMLEALPDMEVIADTEFAEEAIRLVEEYAPDVVMLDLQLETSGKITGLDALKAISTSSPSTHIVVLSQHSDDSYVFPALHNGATAYLLKRSAPDEVIEAIRDAAKGRSRIDQALWPKIFARLPDEREITNNAATQNATPVKLTPREQEIAPLLKKGMTNREISAELSISVSTVKTHVSNILGKLGASNRHKLD